MAKKKVKKAKRNQAWMARNNIGGDKSYVVSEQEPRDGGFRGPKYHLPFDVRWYDDEGEESFCPKQFRRMVNLEHPLRPGAKPRLVEITIREVKRGRR